MRYEDHAGVAVRIHGPVVAKESFQDVQYALQEQEKLRFTNHMWFLLHLRNEVSVHKAGFWEGPGQYNWKLDQSRLVVSSRFPFCDLFQISDEEIWGWSTELR